MSTIVARATVPAHARLSEADTVAFPAFDTSDPDDQAAAAYLLTVEKQIAALYADSGQPPAPAPGHPDWETDCIPGDTPLHISRHFAVTVPSGLRGKTTSLGAQVQQNDGDPADIWLSGASDLAITPDAAERYAAALLAAAALARRVNADRITGAEGGAAA